jgi:hypothetical protein
MQLVQTEANVTDSQSQNLNMELKVCRSGLAHGRALATQDQLASATRDVWVVADAAHAIKVFLDGMKDGDGLARLRTALAEVQSGLNDLRSYLDIPPEAN